MSRQHNVHQNKKFSASLSEASFEESKVPKTEAAKYFDRNLHLDRLKSRVEAKKNIEQHFAGEILTADEITESQDFRGNNRYSEIAKKVHAIEENIDKKYNFKARDMNNSLRAVVAATIGAPTVNTRIAEAYEDYESASDFVKFVAKNIPDYSSSVCDTDDVKVALKRDCPITAFILKATARMAQEANATRCLNVLTLIEKSKGATSVDGVNHWMRISLILRTPDPIAEIKGMVNRGYRFFKCIGYTFFEARNALAETRNQEFLDHVFQNYHFHWFFIMRLFKRIAERGTIEAFRALCSSVYREVVEYPDTYKSVMLLALEHENYDVAFELLDVTPSSKLDQKLYIRMAIKLIESGNEILFRKFLDKFGTEEQDVGLMIKIANHMSLPHFSIMICNSAGIVFVMDKTLPQLIEVGSLHTALDLLEQNKDGFDDRLHYSEIAIKSCTKTNNDWVKIHDLIKAHNKSGSK